MALRIVTYRNGQSTVYYGPNSRYLGSFDTLAQAVDFANSYGRLTCVSFSGAH